MGLDYNASKLLIWARTHGVSFQKTAMLGRLSFMGVSEVDLRNLFRESGLLAENTTPLTTTGYIEPLLKELGAEVVDSFDASDYERATQLWDMNEPIRQQFHSQYDLVLDGGTFEHVFNFPSAIFSAMKMVKKEGHLMLSVPADGWFGHGFYQFSADLFYAIFSPKNGYEIVKVFAFQDYSKAPIYEVVSPKVLRKRNQLCSQMPVLICVLAKRIGDIPENPEVMQSDYEAVWDAPSQATDKREIPAPFASIFVRRYLKSLATALFNFPFWDRRSFVRWRP